MKIRIRLIAVHAATLFTLFLGVNAVAGPKPLELIKSIPLPKITGGDFDHFAVDLDKNRLYVPSEVYASIEIFNLKTGEHLRSGTGLVKSPHMLALMPDKMELFVADAFGGKTSVYVPSLKQFYVVHTKGEQAAEAGLQIFKVND